MTELKDVRKIVRFCKKNGIIKFKSGDFEIEITQKTLQPVGSSNQSKTADPSSVETFPSWDSLSPEQKILWSATPDIPNS